MTPPLASLRQGGFFYLGSNVFTPEQQTLIDAISKYQDESSFAEVSGQITQYMKETYKIDLKTIAAAVDSVGESIASTTMVEAAKLDFNAADDEEANAFVMAHIDHEAAHLITAIGQQIGVHMFCIGFTFAQKYAEEKVNG